MSAKVKPDNRIRVGDLVRVKIPKFVGRVGYPKDVDDYERELAENPEKQELLNLVFEALTGDDQILGSTGTLDHREMRKHRSRYRVEREIAYLMAVADGFGGRDRTIHWVEYPEHQDMECTVTGLRTACTGRYYAPSGGGGRSYFGDDEDWYEPGGLSDMKHHRLAKVNLYAPSDAGTLKSMGQTLELPVEHLAKVRDSRAMTARHGDCIIYKGETFYVICKVEAGTTIREKAVGLGLVGPELEEYQVRLATRFGPGAREKSRADRYMVSRHSRIPRLNSPNQQLNGERFYMVPVRGTRVVP
jgi:hypothetical protein